VFDTTARRNADLAEAFTILPIFLRESRATLTRLDRFAGDTDPLVQQLRPAARELSPTLVAAGRLAPELRGFFSGLRGTIAASDTGFPALRRLLDDDLPPLLERLGTSVGGQDPYLSHLNSIIQAAKRYKHEITAFLGNSAAATNAFTGAPEAGFQPVKLLRTTSPLYPSSLAAFPQRLTSDRANPYFAPLGYDNLASGLETFANTPCAAGITAELDPNTPLDPIFNALTGGDIAAATDLFNRLEQFAFADQLSTDDVPAPPCKVQEDLKSIGAFTEFTPYLHVRPQP
jgi:hypothetical protein